MLQKQVKRCCFQPFMVQLFRHYFPKLLSSLWYFMIDFMILRSGCVWGHGRRFKTSLFTRVYLRKSVCVFFLSNCFFFYRFSEVDGDGKEHQFHLTGRSLSRERPGESPVNPVWSSPQITHSVLVCGDSSADKMADILFPSFLLAIESSAFVAHFSPL